MEGQLIGLLHNPMDDTKTQDNKIVFKPSTRSSACPEEQNPLFVLQMSTLYVDVGDDVHSVAATDAD